MSADSRSVAYMPGTYAGKRPDFARTAEQMITAWEKKRREAESERTGPAEIAPTICFSRKIGVGALEIADRVSEKIEYRVADRLIIEQISNNRDLSNETIRFFDERYPGKMNELSALLFGEKSFVMSDYMRALCSTVFALAEDQPTIFVGRGAHLMLPRRRVLAVRCICTAEFRIERLARILKIDRAEAQKKLVEADDAQRHFFKKAYGKKDAPPGEFDLIINCDFLGRPAWAAEIVITAFKQKFEDAFHD
jgi:cytidylate kinase